MLFERKSFKSHAGLNLTWKIQCDGLDREDWDTLSQIVSERISFGRVIGIPRGGLVFAEALQVYAQSNSSTVLVADDVYTTGTSMREAMQKLPETTVGVVAFARGPVREPQVYAVFQLWGE